MRLNKMVMKSIMQNGGGTFTTALDSAKVRRGFMVSLEKYEQVVPINKAHTTELNTMVEIATKLNAYIGTWLNDDKIYIDLSININNIEDAIRIGKENNQLAIYDIVNDMVINI